MRFEGVPQLSAILYVKYSGVWSRCVTTDDAWQWSRGPLLSNNLYDGCVYDARVPLSPPRPVRIAAAPGGKMRAQTLEPIRRKKHGIRFPSFLLREDTYIVDFGQNLAGFAALRLPARRQPGQEITISLRGASERGRRPFHRAAAPCQAGGYVCLFRTGGRASRLGTGFYIPRLSIRTDYRFTRSR